MGGLVAGLMRSSAKCQQLDVTLTPVSGRFKQSIPISHSLWGQSSTVDEIVDTMIAYPQAPAAWRRRPHRLTIVPMLSTFLPS